MGITQPCSLEYLPAILFIHQGNFGLLSLSHALKQRCLAFRRCIIINGGGHFYCLRNDVFGPSVQPGEHKQLEQATETLATFNEMMSQFHPLEVERYNRELESFFSAYEQYLRNSIEYKNRWARTLRLEVQLVNDGTCPAEDIDVALDFPEGVTLLAEGSLPPPL